MAAFGAATILMDILHLNFLQPTPLFPLRNKTKAKALYSNLSSLQKSLEQDFKVGECYEAMKGLEAEMRDVCVELRFQIEEQLRLFYLGKSTKLRLHSARKVLRKLNRAIKGGGIETMDFNSVVEMLGKHLMLPVSRMPARIKKRCKSFCTQHQLFLYKQKRKDKQYSEDEQESEDEQYSEDEQESEDEQYSEDEQESQDEQYSEDEQEIEDEQYSDDEEESKDEQYSDDEQEIEDEQYSEDEQEIEDEQYSVDEQESQDEKEIDDEQDRACWLMLNIKSFFRRKIQDEKEAERRRHMLYEEAERRRHMLYEEAERKRHMLYEEAERRRHMLYDEAERMAYMLYEAESIMRQELGAPSSYLYQYIKQRIHARHRIRQLFLQGIRLTSYINKQMLKLKNGFNQSKTPLENNTCASLRGSSGGENITVGHSLQQTSMSSTIQMVGCDDEFNMIMDKLNQQSKEGKIVSIVGMGGIGKTTLARRIYGAGDDSFVSHFDCRAWVTISQDYNPTQVFQGLLQSLPSTDDQEKKEASNNTTLAERVCRRLKGQRYLIVIDDIWSTDVLDDLMRCFQDENNGSRMLLTTRLKNVADYAATSGTNSCHTMRFLDSYESWNLFQSKVCKRSITLSPEFEKIGRQIVNKCKGLPLAITVAAGLLSNSNQTFIHEWERIARSVPALSLDHSNQQGESIIDLSYTFLPHHLKLCFLSFGCFPEDHKVDEDRIIDFWVSEGFLKVLRSERLEDVARKNLQDLVDRNLVLIFRGYEGLCYQMHDVLRELALREAQKENLLCFKKGYDISLKWKRNQSVNSSRISQLQSRICSYNSITPATNTSSLIQSYNWTSRPAVVHAHFKFLRAFRVCRKIDNYNIFLEIVDRVHLRRLTISCRLNTHYLPLFMLRNLQKLRVQVYSSCKPLDIWGLPQLRNLSVSCTAVTVVPPKSVHHNLESITSLEYRSCTKELFLRIPNLRTLEVTTDPRIKCKAPTLFQSLVYLYKLEHLAVTDVLLHREFTAIRSMGILSLENFLPNLKKLEFFETYLKWKDIDVVGTLSKLESLTLGYDAVKDRKWEPKDGGFRRLKFLKIFRSLQYWEVTGDHFPVLEKLVLCYIDLKEIPSGFGDITTLKSIELQHCSKSLISSAKRIEKEQQDYGNDTFVVDIYR